MSLLVKVMLGLLAIAVLGAGAATAFVLVVLNNPNEATAKYIPSSATAYFSINLRPGLRQTISAGSFFSKIDSDELVDWREERLDEIEDETGIHPADDTAAWLGTDISAAILNNDLDEPEWIVMLQVSDRDEAEDFADDLVDYLEENTGTDFDDDDDDGLTIWTNSEDSIAVAVSDAYLLVGDSEDTVEDIAENVDEPLRRSLLDNEAFVAAQEAAPSPRVAFAFVDIDEFWDLADEALEVEDLTGFRLRGVQQTLPDYLSMSTSFVDSGVRFDVAYAPRDGEIVWNVDPVSSHEALPSDTVFATAVTGIDQAWANFWFTLADLDPDLYDEIDGALWEFESQIGVDIEDDVIEALSGEAAFALLPSDLPPGVFNGIGPDDATLEMLLIAGVENRQDLEDARADFAATLRSEGTPIRRWELGDYDVLSISEGAEISFGPTYEFGVLVTDEWVAVGSTRESLELFHESSTSGEDTLDETPAFRRAADALPDPIEFLIYANIQGFLEMVEDGLDSEARRDYREDVRPWLENLSAFMMASSITTEEVRVTSVLTVSD